MKLKRTTTVLAALTVATTLGALLLGRGSSVRAGSAPQSLVDRLAVINIQFQPLAAATARDVEARGASPADVARRAQADQPGARRTVVYLGTLTVDNVRTGGDDSPRLIQNLPAYAVLLDEVPVHLHGPIRNGPTTVKMTVVPFYNASTGQG